MTTNLFVDFGGGVGMGNTLDTTVRGFVDIFGSNTGTNLIGGNAGLAATDSLSFTPLSYDFNLDGNTDDADITALANAVIPMVERALEPFDIDVVTGMATNANGILTSVNANDNDPTGEFDAYVFATTVTSDGLAANANSVGIQSTTIVSNGPNLVLNGQAAGRDLNAQSGNNTDEAAITFADVIFNNSGISGNVAFNNNFAARLAYTITHEAFHTFTYRHTPDENGTTPQVSNNQRLLASGDVIRRGSNTSTDPFIVTRFNLLTDSGGAVNNYNIAANDGDIGLRDNNRDGIPDLAYSTGTGAHDQITLAANDNLVDVSIDAYSDIPRTNPNLISSESYSIDLSTGTENEILVDASINSDEVVVDASIGTDLRLRGGEGRDTSVTPVAEADLLTLQSNGLSGTYTPGNDIESGSVSYGGGAKIDFSEFEEIEADNIPILVNPLNLSSTSITENDFLTLNGDFINIDTEDAHQVSIDWGDGSANTVLNITAGLRTFNASHQYKDDGPSPGNGTASDPYTIQVTVTDEENDSGTNQAGITVNNASPEITSFSSSADFDNKVEEGEPVDISAFFTDVGELDLHTAIVDWGDGTSEQVTVTQESGFGTVQGSHAYTSGGIYTISLTVTDDDIGQAIDLTTAVVTGVGINNGVLQIVGTNNDDRVSVNRAGSDTLRVHANFLSDGPFREFNESDIDIIRMHLCDGNDQVFTIDSNADIPTIVNGGNGNDILKGGNGPTALIGDAGSDLLIAGKARAVLVGGLGTDRLVGTNESDFLIGGRTVYDSPDPSTNNQQALFAILGEWNSPEILRRTY